MQWQASLLPVCCQTECCAIHRCRDLVRVFAIVQMLQLSKDHDNDKFCWVYRRPHELCVARITIRLLSTLMARCTCLDAHDNLQLHNRLMESLVQHDKLFLPSLTEHCDDVIHSCFVCYSKE